MQCFSQLYKNVTLFFLNMFRAKRLLKTIPQRDIINIIYNINIKMQYFVITISLYLTK